MSNTMNDQSDIFKLFSMTEADLDEIALYRNSVVGRLVHHPFIERFDLSGKYLGHWAFQWVATMGKLNHGVLILKPTDRRSKQLAVVGKAINLIDEFGVDADTAELLVRAMWGIRHTANEDVLGLIVDSLDIALWAGFEENPLGWMKERLESTEHGWDRMRSLHVTKVESAYKVVRNYDRLRRGVASGPAFPRTLLNEALKTRRLV